MGVGAVERVTLPFHIFAPKAPLMEAGGVEPP